jgi:3-hydroxyacyl-[acyl-carrier-protein] dehydratase
LPDPAKAAMLGIARTRADMPGRHQHVNEFRETICVTTAHPALPGHFPGRPVVPGVVLLDHVAAALERWRGLRIVGLAQVKFLRPLLPDQTAELVLADDGNGLRFCILHAGTAIVSGSIEGAS